jgi:hypothetical protein
MIDHSVLVQSMPIKAEMTDLSEDDLGQLISKTIALILAKMENTMQAKGLKSWQVLSHSLTRLDRHLLLSVLVQTEN